MSLSHLTRYALSLKPTAAVKGAWRLVKRTATGSLNAVSRRHECSFAPPESAINLTTPIVNLPGATDLQGASPAIMALAEQAIGHTFNLLGSGWVKVTYGMTSAGFNGQLYPLHAPADSPLVLSERLSPGNRSRAQSIRDLISPEYQPIDWHLDFKSGYRWRENQISETVRYGHEAGVDIKVPWELARLQHLPHLALACHLAKGGNTGGSSHADYIKEFQNQTLDFIAANPPGWGVNWACTMDVAIRAANMILAFDLFRAQGTEFDQRFIGEFMASLRAHGRHIVNNLEWQPEQRGNHYLANIAGLLIVARFLPSAPETNTWLAFGIQELIKEGEHQFSDDGSNFEASSCYHRLSAEMMIYATALVLGLPEDRRQATEDTQPTLWTHKPSLNAAAWHWNPSHGPLPASHVSSLLKMAEFTMRITKPGGRVVQIGDNDNGRFFRFCPTHDEIDLTENHLDHRALIAAINGLFNREDLTAFAGPCFTVEAALVHSLSGNSRLISSTPDRPQHIITNSTKTCDAASLTQININLPGPMLTRGLSIFSFADFGLFIWRSDRLFLSVRAGPVGQKGRGGHAHNDQLAIELQIDGEDWVADPGSYIYTADPKLRDAYRSTFAHATPRVAPGEPSSLGLGMFRLENNTNAKCLRFDEAGFHGTHNGYGATVFRQIEISDGQITIRDGFGGDIPGEATPKIHTASTPEELRAIFDLTILFSSGYGCRDIKA